MPLTLQERARLNALAFLSVYTAQPAGVRPFSFHTLNCLQLLDVIGEGDDGRAALRDCSERLRARDFVHAYFFLHAAPLDAVEHAVRHYVAGRPGSPEDAWDVFMAVHVAPCIATLSESEIARLHRELAKLPEIEAAQVSASPPDYQRWTAQDVDLLEPGWQAARLTAFACELTWEEDYLRIWLPLARAEQYYHALLRRTDWTTTLPLPPAAAQVAALATASPLPLEAPPGIAAALTRFDAQKRP